VAETVQPVMSDGDGQPLGDAWVTLAPGVRVRRGALQFSAVRSSGPGGQNVNKVSTRAELRVNVAEIPLKAGALARLRGFAGSKLTAAGDLLLASDEHRSLRQNRSAVLERLRDLVERALVVPKPRVATKPTKGSQRRRIEAKSRTSQIKSGRRSRPGSGADE